jgi:hypothetical protein
MAALLPAVIRDFAVPFADLDTAAWTVTGYLGAYAAVLMLAGRAIDRGAADAARIGAIALFGTGSAACGLAGDLVPLVAARTAQGVGAGVLVPLALSEAASGGSVADRVARLGLVMAVAEGGAVLGPLYGAAFVALADWRWAFWTNVPVAAALVVTWAPHLRLGHLARLRGAIGAADALAAAAVAVLVVGVSREAARAGGWTPWIAGILAAAGLAVAARLGSWWRGPGGVATAAALLAHLALGVALVTPLVLVPVWASTLLGREPQTAALVLLRATLAIPPFAVLGGLAAPRVGRGLVAAGGFAVAALGLWLMARWPADVTEAGMTPALVIAGAGLGTLLAPTTEALLDVAAARDSAARLGWATATRVVGMAAGLAVMTAWGVDRFTERVRAILLQGQPVSGAQVGVPLEAYRRAATDAGVEVLGTLFLAGALAATMGALCIVVALRGRGTLRPG